MQARPSGSPGRFRSLVGLGLVGVLSLLLVAGYRSYRDLEAAKGRKESLEQSLEATRERVVALEREVEQLRDRPEVLERVAREELGMVRPGDVVIVLEPAPEAAQASSSDPHDGR